MRGMGRGERCPLTTRVRSGEGAVLNFQVKNAGFYAFSVDKKPGGTGKLN